MHSQSSIKAWPAWIQAGDNTLTWHDVMIKVARPAPAPWTLLSPLKALSEQPGEPGSDPRAAGARCLHARHFASAAACRADSMA